MFSMCSKLTPRARILDTRIPQLMQPCLHMQYVTSTRKYCGNLKVLCFTATDYPASLVLEHQRPCCELGFGSKTLPLLPNNVNGECHKQCQITPKAYYPIAMSF